MEIRDPKIRQQYKEAKEFIKKYEQEYNRVLHTNKTPFDPDIWELRIILGHKLFRAKMFDVDKHHPFYLSIEVQRKILWERLKAKYHKIPKEG